MYILFIKWNDIMNINESCPILFHLWHLHNPFSFMTFTKPIYKCDVCNMWHDSFNCDVVSHLHNPFTNVTFTRVMWLISICHPTCVTCVDGHCSTVQGLLDWFEVDLGFSELLFVSICHPICVTWFIDRDMIHLSNCKLWLDLAHMIESWYTRKRVMVHSVTWFIYPTANYDLTFIHVWHNSIICTFVSICHPTCVKWFIDPTANCDLTFIHVWHDSFICTTSPVCICGTIPSWVCYDSFVCVP